MMRLCMVMLTFFFRPMRFWHFCNFRRRASPRFFLSLFLFGLFLTPSFRDFFSSRGGWSSPSSRKTPTWALSSPYFHSNRKESTGIHLRASSDSNTRGRGMEEQFILRVPPSVAERIDRLLTENASSSDDKSLDLSFSEDGRSGKFVIGSDQFPAFLLDLPCVVESYKTYDDSVLIKTADIGQMIMVKEEGDSIPDEVEYRHGLTPPMRDARRRRFRREPDLNPELVRRVEKDLQNIMAGGTAENIDVEAAEQEDDGDDNARNASKKAEPKPPEKPDVPEAGTAGAEPDRSDSDESDDSI